MQQTTRSIRVQVVFPSEFRNKDGLKPGETFEVERTKAGEYVFRRKKRGSEGLLAALLACPEKGWFQPMPDTETVDSMRSPFE